MLTSFFKVESVPVIKRLQPATDAILRLIKCGCAKERCFTISCQWRNMVSQCADLCSCNDAEDDRSYDNVADDDDNESSDVDNVDDKEDADWEEGDK